MNGLEVKPVVPEKLDMAVFVAIADGISDEFWADIVEDVGGVKVIFVDGLSRRTWYELGDDKSMLGTIDGRRGNVYLNQTKIDELSLGDVDEVAMLADAIPEELAHLKMEQIDDREGRKEVYDYMMLNFGLAGPEDNRRLIRMGDEDMQTELWKTFLNFGSISPHDPQLASTEFYLSNTTPNATLRAVVGVDEYTYHYMLINDAELHEGLMRQVAVGEVEGVKKMCSFLVETNLSKVVPFISEDLVPYGSMGEFEEEMLVKADEYRTLSYEERQLLIKAEAYLEGSYRELVEDIFELRESDGSLNDEAKEELIGRYARKSGEELVRYLLVEGWNVDEERALELSENDEGLFEDNLEEVVGQLVNGGEVSRFTGRFSGIEVGQ